MAYRMSYDDIKSEQESQRDLFYTPSQFGEGPDLYRPNSRISTNGGGGGGGGSTRGKCLHCEQPGHQWRVCQWRCAHCGTYEHSHVPDQRASTQCPALLAKKPKIYEQHSYRHTTDPSFVSRAEDVAELSHVMERFMQGLRCENEGLRNDLLRTQRYADLLERDLRETRERFWEERATRDQAENELKDEDAMREEEQQQAANAPEPTTATNATTTPTINQVERPRRLQVQRQRRTRRYQSDAQRRMNERGFPFGGPRPY